MRSRIQDYRSALNHGGGGIKKLVSIKDAKIK